MHELDFDNIEFEALKDQSRNHIRLKAKAATRFVSQHGLAYRDGFQSLTPQELEDLGLAMLDASSVNKAYDLLSKVPSDGSISYYDRLIADPQHYETYKKLDLTLQKTEPNRVDRAIDIASGNGFCAMILSQFADHVSAVDSSKGILTVAERQLRRLHRIGGYMKTYEVRQMDALHFDYPDESFDIAVSNAFTHYLTYKEQEAFYQEVHRILKPGGRYFEPQQDGATSDLDYSLSPRGILAQEVAKVPLILRDPSKFINGTRPAMAPDLEEHGFKITRYVHQTFPFTRQVVRAVKE